MSHNLTVRENGQVEMAYVGKLPWHKLGTQVDNPMTAEEAIIQGGLDWEVKGYPVEYHADHHFTNGPGYIKVPNRQVIVREDTGLIMQTCSTDYKIVQNTHSLSFFDGVVGSGEAIYHTVGSLNGGKRIWVMAKLPGDLDLGDGDLLEKYILLANSHDGSMQVTMKLTPMRVVCDNTCSAALLGEGAQVKIRHTTNVLTRMNATRDALGLAEAHFELFMQHATRLAEKRFTAGNVRDIAARVFDFDRHVLEGENFSKMKSNATDRVVELFEGDGMGAKLGTANHTGWGAYNAFTQYIDYELGVAGSRAKTVNEALVSNKRLDASWFGRGEDMRQKAWSSAMGLLV